MNSNITWLEEKIFHRPLTDDEKHILEELLQTQHFNKGDIIIEEGQAADGLFILASGAVALEHQKHGQSVRLANLEAGSQLGDMSSFNGEPASATAKALEASEVYHFPQASIQYMMEHSQGLSRDIMLNTIRNLGKAVRQMNDSQALTQQYIQGMSK